MKLAKLSCPVISEALKDRKTFGMLSLYMEGFAGYERTDDECFLSKIVPFEGKPTLNFKLSLEDYFFNEPESEELWKLAEKLTGKTDIKWTILKVVEL